MKLSYGSRISKSLLWSSLLSSLRFSHVGGQSVDAETVSRRRTVTATELVFFTTTIVLPSCPCPVTSLGTGSTFTSTFATPSVPSASGVALHIDIIPTDGTDPEEFFLNVDGNRAVTDAAPVLLYFKDNGQIAEAENLNNLLFLSLISAISNTRRDRSLINIVPRQDIFGFYPVFLGAPFEGTTTQNFFLNDEGKLNLRYQNETGFVSLYEVALCRVDGLLSRQVYMHEVDAAYPPECYAANAYLVADAKIPSTTASEISITSKSTSSSSVISPNSFTGFSTSNFNTGSTSIRSSSRSSSSSSASSDSTSSSDSSSSSSTSSSLSAESSTTETRGTTTITIYTEEVSPGSRSTRVNSPETGLVTVSAYLPYPSSLKILSYENEDVFGEFIGAFFGPFLLPAPNADAESLDYRIFVLTPEGWLMNPISGPKLLNGVWDGSPLTYLDEPRYIYVRDEVAGGSSYPRLSIDTLSAIAASNGQLLTFEALQDGTLTLKTSLNVTAGSGIWVCASGDPAFGLTDGTNNVCRFGKITNIQIRGHQEIVTAPTPRFDFITTQRVTTITAGVGPTATVYTILSRAIETVTIPITAGNPGFTTVNTALTDPTATVTFNQFLVTRTTSVWGRTTGNPQTTTIGTNEMTKTISIESAYPLTMNPVSIYDIWTHNLRISEATETPKLQGYGPDTGTFSVSDYISLWVLIDGALVVTHKRKGDTEFFGTEPHYAFYDSTDHNIYFCNMTYGTSDAKYKLLKWVVDTEAGSDPLKRWVWLNPADAVSSNYLSWRLVGCTSTTVINDLQILDPANTPNINDCSWFGGDYSINSDFILWWDTEPYAGLGR